MNKRIYIGITPTPIKNNKWHSGDMFPVDPDWEIKLMISIEENRRKFNIDLDMNCLLLKNGFTDYVLRKIYAQLKPSAWKDIFFEFDSFHTDLICRDIELKTAKLSEELNWLYKI